MNFKTLATALLTATVGLTACSSDDGEPSAAVLRPAAEVTLLITPNGIGDNGYNDCIVDGLFRFYEQTGVPVKLLQPNDSAEAVSMYKSWLSDHQVADSAVLVVGSSAYEQMVTSQLPRLTGTGSRVLLMESLLSQEGVSSVFINRYGVSYWAGAMLHDCPVMVYAAAPGIPVLEPAIEGFLDGHDCQLPHEGRDSVAMVYYLTDTESGFASAETAYKFMFNYIYEFDGDLLFDVSVFPLLGGSGSGVIRAINDIRLTTSILVGMDVDQSALSQHIPFSVVTRIDRVLSDYLTDWREGRDWPRTQVLGLKDGATDIVLSTTYVHPFAAYINNGTADAQQIKERYDLYREEALRKEAEYEKR